MFRWIFAGSIGLILALGLSSCVYFLMLWGGIATTLAVALLEIVVVACAFLGAIKDVKVTESPKGPTVPYDWVLAVVLIAALAFSGLWASKYLDATPNGNWDAWSMWNTRAKFLASPATWRNAVSPALETIHPDYPLLLPALVAWPWRLLADTKPFIPVTIAFLFAAGIVGTLVGCIGVARSRASAWIAGVLFLAGSTFIGETMSLYADVPLAAFLVAAVALVVTSETTPALVLAGVCAGLAAWTKNEGLLVLPILLVATAVFRRIVDAAKIFAGALPILAIVIAYKTLLTPATNQFTRQAPGAIGSKLADAGRYAQVAGAYTAEILNFAPYYAHPVLLTALLAWALRLVEGEERRRALLALTVVLTMGSAYFVSFVVTPYELGWHLSTALSRLLVQIWPAAVLAVMFGLRSPEDYVPANQELEETRGKRSRSLSRSRR